MRAVPYKRVYEDVISLAGWSSSIVTQTMADDVRNFISARLSRIWEMFPWPDLTKVEKRYYREGLWSAGSYSEGDIVYHEDDDKYYEADSDTSEEPSSTASDWTEATSFAHYVPYEQTEGGVSKTKIDPQGVVTGWNQDPRLEPRGARVDIHLIEEGVLTSNDEINPLFLQFKEQCHELYGDEYDNSTAYSAGDQIYYDTTGDFYEAVQPSTGNLPTDTAFWTKLQIPWYFKQYLARAALADYYVSQGALDQATRQEQFADEWEEDQYYKFALMAGQTTPYQVRTGDMSGRTYSGIGTYTTN